jgi:hypothetical protein
MRPSSLVRAWRHLQGSWTSFHGWLIRIGVLTPQAKKYSFPTRNKLLGAHCSSTYSHVPHALQGDDVR